MEICKKCIQYELFGKIKCFFVILCGWVWQFVLQFHLVLGGRMNMEISCLPTNKDKMNLFQTLTNPSLPTYRPTHLIIIINGWNMTKSHHFITDIFPPWWEWEWKKSWENNWKKVGKKIGKKGWRKSWGKNWRKKVGKNLEKKKLGEKL